VTEQILSALIASGPLAMVLGVAVYVLWKTNRNLQTESVAREDAIRAEHEERIRGLETRVDVVFERLITELQKGGPSD